MALELLPESEWLARRKLSASRIAAVYTERIGLLTLWAILTGKEREEFPELLGDFGRATEPVSRKWFSRSFDRAAAVSPGPPSWARREVALVSSSGPLTASPDTLWGPKLGLLSDVNGFAEHKTCDRVAAYKWRGGPDRYAYVQIQATFAAARAAGLGWQGAYATALIGNGYDAERDFLVYPVERDEDFIGEIREWAEGFWKNHVEADIPPDPDGLEATLKTIRLLFPPHTKGEERRVGVLGAGAWDHQLEVERLKRDIDGLERVASRHKQELELMLANAGLDEAALPATPERPNPPRWQRLKYTRRGYEVKEAEVTQFRLLR